MPKGTKRKRPNEDKLPQTPANQRSTITSEKDQRNKKTRTQPNQVPAIFSPSQQEFFTPHNPRGSLLVPVVKRRKITSSSFNNPTTKASKNLAGTLDEEATRTHYSKTTATTEGSDTKVRLVSITPVDSDLEYNSNEANNQEAITPLVTPASTP